MLHLGAQPYAHAVFAVRAEVGACCAAVERPESAEVALLGLHLAAEAEPARLLHRLSERHFGAHALGVGLFEEDVAEILDGGGPVLLVRARGKVLFFDLNHATMSAAATVDLPMITGSSS